VHEAALAGPLYVVAREIERHIGTGHWFRLMADPHEQFFWTLQQCSVMLLHRETSLSSGGEYDIDAKAMPLL
jgi:hypothetical protein